MKNPLQKVIAAFPNNKVEFQWKNAGQLTHVIVDGKRLGFQGLSRSLFGLLQYHDVSFDDELYNVLKQLVDELIKQKI